MHLKRTNAFALSVSLGALFAASNAVAQPVAQAPTTTAPAAAPNGPPVAGALPPASTTGAMPGSAAADLGERATRTSHDFIDTRITWTFGDDDVLADTGQRVPVSPLPRIGDRQQYQLFFDALNSRFAGRENLTHLAMYARAPGFIPRVNTEAALVLRVDLSQLSTGSGNLNQAFYDAGTYLRVSYALSSQRPTDALALTFFPFDTDRFRLGYLWDLSWGGNDIFPRRVGPAPGLKVSLDVGALSVWAGFKTASIVVPLEVVTSSRDIETVRVEETQYAGLGGVGVRLGDLGRVDVSGGWFGQGRFDFAGVRGQPVYIFGASARVLFAQGLRTSQSLDMMLYRNDPTSPFVAFAPETYAPGRLQWSVSAEATAVAQNLADISNPGATTLQPGIAGAVQARLKYGYFGAGVTGLYRDAAFLLRNVPSFIPFQTFPSDAQVDPEYFFAGQLDYAFAAAHLVPSLIVGMQFPSTFRSTVSEGSLQSLRTLVIRRAGNFSILPPGESAVPILSARASLRWDLSTIMAGIVWVQYVADANATLLQVDSSGTRQVRIFQSPNQLGFGLTVQARF
ncbi:MAG: hypothetical protein U0326_34745 [Polyangiales bacterium]